MAFRKISALKSYLFYYIKGLNWKQSQSLDIFLLKCPVFRPVKYPSDHKKNSKSLYSFFCCEYTVGNRDSRRKGVIL